MADNIIEHVIHISGEQAEQTLENVANEAQRTNAALSAQPAVLQRSQSAMDATARSAGNLKAGMFSLGQQVQDVSVMLVGGASPFTVLATQGPQIATAVTQMGGLSVALKEVGAAALAAGPLLAGIALAAAAVTTAYAVLTNATMTAASEARDHNEALVEQALAAYNTSEDVKKLTDAWGKYTDHADDIKRQIDLINGKITESEAAAEKASKAVRDLAEANIKAQAAEVGRLTVALTAAQEDSKNKDLPAAERATASGQAVELQKRLDAAQSLLDATRAQVDADADAAAGVAEYNAETRKAEEALRAREEAARRAAAAMREHAAAERAAREETSRWITTYIDGLSRGMFAVDPVRQSGLAVLEHAAAFDVLAGSAVDAATVQADLTLALSRGAITAQEYEQAVRALTAAERDRAQAAADSAQAAAGTVQGGMSGLFKLLEQMGPVGQIVSAVVQIVANIERFLDGAHEFVVSFADTVGRLPDILADAMMRSMEGFDLFGDAAEKFADGLEERLPDLIAGSLETIPRSIGMIVDLLIVRVPEIAIAFVTALLNPDTWAQVAQAFVRAIGEAVGGIVSGVGNVGTRAGNAVTEIFSGGSGSGQRGTGSSRSSARASSGPQTVAVFQGPVLGLGVNGAERIATEMTGRGFMRTPG